MTRFVFDGLGRRVRRIGADGSSTEYVWDKFGYLGETITRDPDGQTLATNRLWVDALGELASVDGVPMWWDTATPTPALVGVGQDQVLSLPGEVTGLGEAWLKPSCRGHGPRTRLIRGPVLVSRPSRNPPQAQSPGRVACQGPGLVVLLVPCPREWDSPPRAGSILPGSTG